MRLDSCTNINRKQGPVPPVLAQSSAVVRRQVKHGASRKAMRPMLPQSRQGIKELHRAERAHTWVDLLSAQPLGAPESYIALHQHLMAVAGIQ